MIQNWVDASTWATGRTTGGHGDWRLPTPKELASIVDYNSQGGVKINQTYFPNVRPSYYWSDAVDVSDTGKAWTTEFAAGLTQSRNKPYISSR